MSTPFNTLPDNPTLKAACLHHGGAEDVEKNEFTFVDTDCAIAAARAVGYILDIPAKARGHRIKLGSTNDGRLVTTIDRRAKDGDLPGWVSGYCRWTQASPAPVKVVEDRNFDELLRNVVSPDGGSEGWMICTANGSWRAASKDDVRCVLVASDIPSADVEAILGNSLLNPWKLVNRPFGDEYPGCRQWNHKAAQFSVEPADGPHPHWDMVMRHCGRDLDAYLPQLDWAREARILDGADYLRVWLANMIRNPLGHLPYLFFFGNENSGKSIFHEAASLLMTRGVVIADRALTNQNDFNGELANAILCVVEEKNVTKAPGAANKIKQWVTGEIISIQKKGTDSYMQPNTTHWVQCANDRKFCPVFPGDSRKTMIRVDHPEAEIPKPILLGRLKAEAPHFLHTLLAMELPQPRGRLGIPVVETTDKLSAAKSTVRDDEYAAQFVREHVTRCPGENLPIAELQAAFRAWLPDDWDEWADPRTFGLAISGTLDDLGFIRKKKTKKNVMHILDAALAPAAIAA